MARVLLVVSVRLPTEPLDPPGPRKDYTALASALNATVIDYASVGRSRIGRIVARIAGVSVAQAVLAFLARGRFDSLQVFLQLDQLLFAVGSPLRRAIKDQRHRTFL